MVLPKYPETGDKDSYFAQSRIVSDAPVAVAPDPPPLKTKITVATPMTVPPPMTILTWLVDTSVHDAVVELTVAVQLFSGVGSKKFDPNIDTVDPIKAEFGFVPDMFGDDETTSKLEFARAPDPPLFIDISTKAFPVVEFDGISITICVALTIEQKRDTIALTVAMQE
jgi:hypothetical protein